MPEIEIIEQLIAVDDDGDQYRITIYQEFHERRSMNAPGGMLPRYPGLKHARLSDGTPLNTVDDGDTFTIFDTGTVLRRQPQGA
ncbi:hypothetical protein DPM33_24555 [Mesorhizobium hawassense]|uniref:Uncharacterized protein n=1 Tax=Mesorhizobium hawassense TaxID=1209954 RepID=A0A330HJ36_9HYPH|nr:hypothetical protein [Mesorhizobium hawassense]RAZ88263.1 hypothetical protein DPM33_24555 [Mesorhizobium hawassense]